MLNVCLSRDAEIEADSDLCLRGAKSIFAVVPRAFLAQVSTGLATHKEITRAVIDLAEHPDEAKETVLARHKDPFTGKPLRFGKNLGVFSAGPNGIYEGTGDDKSDRIVPASTISDKPAKAASGNSRSEVVIWQQLQ